MNKSKLKTYAPQARKDFIAAVTQRANLLGLSDTASGFAALPAERKGDVVIIAGREWPASVGQQRERLMRRIQRDGFAHTLEAVAYTWFNRFAALRFMELHDYLGHGHRVLSSSTAGALPDILTHAADLAASRELPGLDAAHIAELKLAGNKDGELYRLLLVAQCNALSAAMPFLFERIDDETELLLPDNLLRTDSVIARLVAEIAEEDWAEVEIIGWLYQFYISEKKDEVIGKVVKSEDIPAATQLFTPNWIVQYLVQNSVGRLWLMASERQGAASTLKSQWPYYIEPAEQTPEVNAQLDALIEARMAEDGGSLNPESITVLDPACGSGHILVEAYALLKGIYLERGYRLRDIPRLILEKNLYGLDIDDRAAQLAGFALLMKARADDRRLFNDPPRLNVLSLQESKGLELDELATHLAPFGVQRGTIKALLDTFEHAKTFGSLIQIPDVLNAQLPVLAEGLGKASETGDLYAQAAAQDLLALVEQAQVLGRKFDAVVANPPYMGGRVMPGPLKTLLEYWSEAATADIYAAFVLRAIPFTKSSGIISLITLQTWMFLVSFNQLRRRILGETTVSTLLHIGFNTFPELNSKIAQGSALVLFNSKINSHKGSYIGLNHLPQSFDKKAGFYLDRKTFFRNQDDFFLIPDCCIGYWASDKLFGLFGKSTTLESVAPVRQGFQTGNNDRFLRFWFEISWMHVIVDAKSKEDVFNLKRKWVPYNKGGAFRKWYGNHDYVVAFDEESYRMLSSLGNCLPSRHLYFKPAVTWSALTSSAFGARLSPEGFTFSAKGACAFPPDEKRSLVIALLNSAISKSVLSIFAASLDFNVGSIKNIPLSDDFPGSDIVEANAVEAIEIAQGDWDASEVSWGFMTLPWLGKTGAHMKMAATWSDWDTRCQSLVTRMMAIEEENNRLFIEAYGLQEEIASDVPRDQITLSRPDREKDSQRLISYIIGCMMGRYSLDEPGLIYAHAGNVGFDSTRYKTFPADADGIVPITDEFWFEDDAAHRVREFLRAVWGADTLDENMAWLAESLGTKASQSTQLSPDETIRRYLADKFFKDHLQTYKKRPIYWLFSSGKQGAFQALVYLHRYHEGTLARLRAEYVVPLTGKLQARIEMLEKDAAAASSTAARNKLGKQIEKLRKKHVELLAYDEKLRHHADMRISLDLDDGVKVNYGKFGDLLAEVKAVTGGAGDE
ncbi:hypothetical protein ZRA01_33100 [Zoogloea ramigera]|uniref:site-specific DNA-methyltransferase (adenine-specific) n=1 Tax=Zoogloea ramigera TaxID=350 RepID=A0A4Y4D1T7_ZOORA|nr:BREX-1 system adenine-specific DNA-methyltransferase PglX [Zoogloea ramigera]GEC97237.1 hypothetical protein ZRA01_33100 [Zoogloea ramigera]